MTGSLRLAASTAPLLATRILSVCLLLLFVLTCPAHAATHARGRTNQIRFTYVPPKTPALQQLADELRKDRVLEILSEVLSPLRLRAPVILKLESCDGVANAWYEERTVTVCYEYIQDAIRNAPTETTPDGVRRQDAIVGPTIEVFLHEMGHAVFDVLRIPIFGREEDAADQFAAFMLLRLSNEDMRPVIRGVAYLYAQEARTLIPGRIHFADTHGLPAQRMFNLICLAYGAHPAQFAEVIEKGYLPKERAEICAEEYEQVAYAFSTLIGPHIDTALRDKIRAKYSKRRWIKPDLIPAAPPAKN